MPCYTRIVLVPRLHFRPSSTLRFQISRWRNHDLDWLISQHRSQLDSQSRGTAAVHLFCGAMCHPIFFPHDRFSPVNLTARLPLSRRLSPVLSTQHRPYIKITYVDFFFLAIPSIPVYSFSRSDFFHIDYNFESKTFCSN